MLGNSGYDKFAVEIREKLSCSSIFNQTLNHMKKLIATGVNLKLQAVAAYNLR